MDPNWSELRPYSFFCSFAKKRIDKLKRIKVSKSRITKLTLHVFYLVPVGTSKYLPTSSGN